MKPNITHEEFIRKVRDITVAHIADTDTRARLNACKLVYGCGDGTYRGICYFEAWKNGHTDSSEFVEIAATGEESPVQLAGTTLHELGHVLAGKNAGHALAWKQACEAIGLRCAHAVATRYSLAHFAPAIRAEIAAISQLSDGSPVFGPRGAAGYVGLPPIQLKPCPLGIGTRGGKSRGKGSGSRLRLWLCACEKPVKVRVSSDEFKAHCDVCHEAFKRAEVAA